MRHDGPSPGRDGPSRAGLASAAAYLNRVRVPALAMFLISAQSASAATTYSTDYRYIDGTTAHAEPSCATADLCGAITLRGGDVISIYSEATLRCESPALHVTRRRGSQTILSYELFTQSEAPHRQASSVSGTLANGCHPSGVHVNFDRGKVRMGVFAMSNGNLFVRFTAGPAQTDATTAPASVQVR